MSEPYEDTNVKFKFGSNPNLYLEHLMRHLENLVFERVNDDISDNQYQKLRRQLKQQYEDLTR